MTTTNGEKPELIFVGNTPKNWLQHPPLASSLQNLETSFLLLAMRRYASALVTCTSAIENSIKAAIDPSRRAPLVSLLRQANSLFGQHAFSDQHLDEFRSMRNRITHYGFSGEDEETCAALLLKTGYPLLDQCYQTFFNYNLKRGKEEYGGLLPNFDRNLEAGQNVYLRVKDTPGLRLSYCFIPLAHEVRWRLQYSMLSSWQLEVLQNEESTGDQSWAFQDAYKNQLQRESFDSVWEFDCPVCEYFETFVCELNEAALTEKDIRLERAVCVQCGLLIPKDCPLIVDELCKDQLDEAHPRILTKFGIE